ncbi:protein pygopus-like [Odontomachus brunneus]|uniref:protein pygopus-like n=1 Tax=Odontomachus brunneus TaxID=486640 RepID=UPI0013F245EE|nr:protein pygopus-like [Odontomachus brunneus]
MHYALHMLFHCIALWCAINGGRTARSAVSPEILANFAKNVASVISPAILGDVQQRSNRSSFRPILTIPIRLDGGPDSESTLDNVVDKRNNAANYYEPRSNPYPYDGLYADSPTGVEETRASGGLEQPEEEAYLRQERPNFYNQPYFSPNDNLRATEKAAVVDGVESSVGSIEQSSTNQYSAYAGAFPKGGFGPYLGGKPYGGFHGPYGSYGHFHPYDDHPDDGGSTEENARVENNGTHHRGYGPPYFDPHGYNHGPYGSPFPYGGYGPYGPNHRNGNDTNGNRPYGPHHGGPDFYGPPGYGYGHHGNGYNGNGNGNGNGNNRQTEEPADNGDQNNGTKNGYPHPYGPPLKPFFHHHGFPPPFNILPYDHFHFKGGPVAGVGHVGYPIFADPYLTGFPFHFPYGPFIHGKKYLPPKDKPDSGESGDQPTANENPDRITEVNQEEVAPAATSNRYKTTEQNGLKRFGLINFQSRKE